MDSLVVSKMKQRNAPGRERFVVMHESRASRRGLYIGLMWALLLLSLGTAAYLLYERYEDIWRQSPAAAAAAAAAADGELPYAELQAELERNRQDRARAREAAALLQRRLEETRALLAATRAEKQGLEAEAARRIEPVAVTLPEAGLAITGFELSGEGKQRNFRLNLVRAYRVDPTLPMDTAVELKIARASELQGTIRLVAIPERDPDARVYVPKKSWRRDNGFALELINGRQEIRGLLEIPEGGLRAVRVEVMIDHPNSEYTLIRRAFRLLGGG